MAKGSFEVRLKPLECSMTGEAGVVLGRMGFDKTFSGDLEGVGVGEMLSARTSVKSSAAYVAMEQISGRLDGKSGSFVVQHAATMHEGEQRQTLEVVPNSGSGELAGIEGTMKIIIKDGLHFYEMHYRLPQ
ncbi:DUF3224 domain-containing protein [Acanthopleuribacter pedis]|nr:DUF3224 domain-containing protein [Acanthopleuribacter pedis]